MYYIWDCIYFYWCYSSCSQWTMRFILSCCNGLIFWNPYHECSSKVAGNTSAYFLSASNLHKPKLTHFSAEYSTTSKYIERHLITICISLDGIPAVCDMFCPFRGSVILPNPIYEISKTLLYFLCIVYTAHLNSVAQWGIDRQDKYYRQI